MALVRVVILGVALAFAHACARAESARGPIIPPGIFLKDLEMPEWRLDWSAAVEAQDCPAVEAHLAKGKAANDPAAMGLEGVMLRDGICRTPDRDGAAAHFLAAIQAGDIAPMIGLGWLHLDDNPGEARRWFQKAFLSWGPLAPWKRLAELVKSGIYLPADDEYPDWVMDEYKRVDYLATRGAEVKLATAEKIEAGDSFAADPQIACLWRRDAAWTPSGAKQLAEQLDEGRGVPRRAHLAAKWYYKLARGGDAAAMARLGKMLIEGDDGLVADPRGAVKLLVRAQADGIDTGDALRAASVKLGSDKAEAIKRKAMDGPLPVPRPVAGVSDKECW